MAYSEKNIIFAEQSTNNQKYIVYMRKFLLLLFVMSYSICHQVIAQEQEVRTVVQTGHISTIQDYDISADGKYAATLDKSSKTIIWNLKTGHQYREFNEKNSSEVFFNSRSTALVIVCKKYTVAYDIATGRRICYWDPKASEMKVKRAPKSIQCEVKGNSLHVYDAESGKKLTELKSIVDGVYKVAAMRDGKHATDELWWASASTPVQWNLKTGQIVNRISFPNKMSSKMWFDANGDLVFWNGKNELCRYKADDGKKIDVIPLAGQGIIHALTFLSDNKNIDYERKNRIWQTNLTTLQSDSLPHVDYYSKSPYTKLNADGTGELIIEDSHVILGTTFAAVKNMKGNKHECRVVGLEKLPAPNEYLAFFREIWVPIKMKLGNTTGTRTGGIFQDDPKALYQMGNGLNIVKGSFMITLLSNLNVIGKYPCNDATSASMFGPNLLAAGKEDGSLWLYDKESSRLTAQLTPHNGIITSICQSPSQRLVLTTSNDGTMAVFDSQQQKLLAYLISSEDGREYIIRTPDNYYMSSRYGTDAIHFAVGTETYQFDQCDIKYNRPDIVLSRIVLADEKQIKILKRAYEKRLKRMHFSEDMLSNDFHVPSLFIKNANNLSQARTPNQEILIEASDSRYNICNVNVWVNGVPSFGVEGKSVNKRKKLSMKIPVTLTRGHNTIQVSCMNERGTESYKETVEADIPIPSAKPDLWIVTLGVSQYKDQRFNLNYASKDAQDVANAISEANQTSYQNVHTLTLKDSDVNTDALVKIKGFLSAAGRDDAVVLFYAGHGLVDESLDYYLGTYDTDFNSPSSNSLPYDVFESLLDGILPLQKLLLIDACHSGEIDKEDVMLAQAQRRTTSKENIIFRSSGEKLPQAMSSTTEQLDVILAENFGNLSRGTGATVISSSSGVQVSVESDQWKNGLFTSCLIQGLHDRNCDTNKDGKININELQRYCQQQVLQFSGGKQRPSSRNENRQINFVIGSY